jgi:hypothetical protein
LSNSSSYGVTSVGFFPKPVSEIVAEIVADELSTIDPALDVGDEGPIGQLNGIMAEKLAEVWELAQFAYNSVNPNDAEGNQLDNVGALTGSQRLTPKPSLVLCTCVLSSVNSPYNQGTLLANVTGQPATQFTNAQTIIVSPPVLPATDPQTITGLPFISVEDGPILAIAGTLTTIAAPVTGWTSITNPLDQVYGTLLELDADFRLRREEELAAAGSGTLDAIESDLLEIDGGAVLAITVLENTLTSPVDANGTPINQVQPVVWDGVTPGAANNDIAQALWNDKPAGISYYGSSSGVAQDVQGNSHTVLFTRPTQEPVYLAYTVTWTPGLSGALQTQAILAIKVAAAAFTSAPGTNAVLQPGVSVVALALRAAALAIPGVFDVPTLALGFSPSPVGTANLAVGPLAVAVVETPNITVNGF